MKENENLDLWGAGKGDPPEPDKWRECTYCGDSFLIETAKDPEGWYCNPCYQNFSWGNFRDD